MCCKSAVLLCASFSAVTLLSASCSVPIDPSGSEKVILYRDAIGINQSDTLLNEVFA